MESLRLVLGVSGASGALYAERTLAALARTPHHVDVVASRIGEAIFRQETGQALARRVEQFTAAGARFRLWERDDLYAPFSSGSQVYDAMAIVPCSAGMLGRIATGVSTDLLSRAGDVFLKEKRRLVLVLRESPLSEIHLRNMLRLSRAGAVILPACPGFYTRPRDLVELADGVVQRILDHMGVELRVHRRWREHAESRRRPASSSPGAGSAGTESTGATELGRGAVLPEEG
jgi:4-hydroxy-3-polyprenylbenzoate decarboxylase